jgi:hypothetical protein
MRHLVLAEVVVEVWKFYNLSRSCPRQFMSAGDPNLKSCLDTGEELGGK